MARRPASFSPGTQEENPFRKIEVECISGWKVEERPTAFLFENRRREIGEILDRWYEGGLDPTRPIVNYFKVRTLEGEVFLLRYLSLFDDWSAMPASRGFSGT